ncbi:MAG: hypothetical protein M3246_01710 [Actinomycetota bacterium]|nr:hypothetical protein [Actinomycetota bacterium]
MKRIMLVLSLAAMFVVAAAPAIAESFFVVEDDLDDSDFIIEGDFDDFDFDGDDVRSGDIDMEVDIFNAGSNVNLCTTVLQSANTGNIQNAQGVFQYNSTADDIEFEGSEIVIASEAEGECVQSIEQEAFVFGVF